MHWNRSWQCVRDRIVSSNDKLLERAVFGKIASSIVKLPVGRQVTAAFEVLCGIRCPKSLLGIVKSLTVEEANFLVAIGKKRNIGLNGGCVPNIFKCYTKNLDSTPLPINQAMINRYKADKFVCAKQVAAEHEVKITYHDKSESARRDSA